MRNPKIVVVIPAFNAQKTLESVCKKIPKTIVDDIIVVNDGSTDNTQALIKKLGVKSRFHPKNRGYGASQKTGYRYALQLCADIIIMLHADGQHDPVFVKDFIPPLLHDSCDLVIGSRIRGMRDAFKNGMPVYKILANRVLSEAANLVTGLSLIEHHTGYRAFKRKVLETIPFDRFSDDFIFDQQIILSVCVHHFRIKQITTSCIYHKDASSVNLSRSVTYGLGVIENLIYYIFDRKRFV